MLHSLQEESETLQNHSRTSKVALLRNKKKCTNTRKRKIAIIGDSHSRGYAAEISSCLGKILRLLEQRFLKLDSKV